MSINSFEVQGKACFSPLNSYRSISIYVDCGGHILHFYKTLPYYSTIVENTDNSCYGKPFHLLFLSFQNSIPPLHFLIEAPISIPFYSHSSGNLNVLEVRRIEMNVFGIPLGIPIHVLWFPLRHKCLSRTPISSSSRQTSYRETEKELGAFLWLHFL